jgi:hypothetical protein
VTAVIQAGPLPAHPERNDLEEDDAKKQRWRLWWAGRHVLSVAALAPVLVLVGLATAWNLQGWPGRVNDDEGTYVSEAWAMIFEHHLSHYTYWYDHPPLGWAQIAAYAWVTDGFARDSSAVMVGREFMWFVTMASCLFLFVLGRRLGLRRVFSAAAVALFGLSPLAIYFHRMVSLDNIGTMWLLASLMFAASRRNSLRASFCSAICLAAGVLSKETIAVLTPAVIWVIWQHTDRRTRAWNLGIFGATYILLVLGYPLTAALRGELLPGPGHVSLAWALWWQFDGRAGSGSPLDPASQASYLVHLWLGLDPWLLGLGVALIPVGLFVRRLRPIAAGLLIQLVIPFKGGYLPYFYVTAMLPFAALLAGGVADACWAPPAGGPRGRFTAGVSAIGTRIGTRIRTAAGAGWLARWAWRIPVLAAAAALALLVAPGWARALDRQSTVRGDVGSLAATHWVEQHIPKSDLVVTDDYIWPDLKIDGMNPLWMWQVGGNPQVTRANLPQGWKSIRYIVMTSETSVMVSQLPTLTQALAHSVVVARFSQGVTVNEVLPGGPPGSAGTANFPGGVSQPTMPGPLFACFTSARGIRQDLRESPGSVQKNLDCS